MCSSWRNWTWLTFKDSETVKRSKLFFVTWVIGSFFIFYWGSHKRSHSLGDKEIRRSPPSPAPEQPFRDRSNTLSEKPALPVIRDKYKDLTGEVEVRGTNCTTDDFITCFKGYQSRLCWFYPLLQESERYAYEWQRCLENALEVCGCCLNHYIMECFVQFLLCR